MGPKADTRIEAVEAELSKLRELEGSIHGLRSEFQTQIHTQSQIQSQIQELSLRMEEFFQRGQDPEKSHQIRPQGSGLTPDPPDLLVTKPLDPLDRAPCPLAQYSSLSLPTKLHSLALNLPKPLLRSVIPSTPLQFSTIKPFAPAFVDPSLMDTDALYPSLVLCDVILFANLDALFMKRGYHFVALDLPPWPHLQCALLMEVFITLKVFTKVTYPSDQTILMESSIDDDLDPPPWPPPSSLHSTPYLAPMNLEKKTMMSQCSTQGNHTTNQGKVSAEGKVLHKFDMKPHNQHMRDYGKLCRERTKKYTTKSRQLQVIENDRGGHMRPMPGMVGLAGFSSKDKKKTLQMKGSDTKRTRRDRGEMEAIMFKLLERKPNWTLRQLVMETDQPEQFLKDMLKDLCVYNNKGQNQGTYELKPEYKRSTEETGLN